jgi:glycosyltransferase involved in cell wall biosynthesis
MLLVGKHVLLLSPQPWGVARVSKHHYAVEIARRGNRVTFATPSFAGRLRRGAFELSPVQEQSGLEVLTYRPLLPAVVRFKLPRLFNLAMRWQARRILRALGVSHVDVVWDFASSPLFADMRAFAAKCYVFHPVDMVPSGDTRGADIIISLTDGILKEFERSGVPSHFVNHGLGDAFAQRGRRILEELDSAALRPREPGPLQIGYAGNLLLPYIDHVSYQRVIERNPQVVFHFWGPYSNSSNNLGAGPRAALEFINFLKKQSNVRLHGAVQPHQLAHAMATMDALVICYDAHRDPNGAANSHKVLEYLSTGRPVISTHISHYVRHPGLLEMLPNHDSSHFPDHFEAVLRRLHDLSSEAMQRVRIQFALGQTYSCQLDRIDSLLSELKLLD